MVPATESFRRIGGENSPSCIHMTGTTAALEGFRWASKNHRAARKDSSLSPYHVLGGSSPSRLPHFSTCHQGREVKKMGLGQKRIEAGAMLLATESFWSQLALMKPRRMIPSHR